MPTSSPFPGMDPYVEAHWRDVHSQLVTYVTILDQQGGQLITVVEFLSPTNKQPGEGAIEYLRQRGKLISAKVNVVEIDLVRRGQWRHSLRPYTAPAGLRSTYRTIVRRFHPARRVELYPISLQARLPRIPVPLRATDGYG